MANIYYIRNIIPYRIIYIILHIINYGIVMNCSNQYKGFQLKLFIKLSEFCPNSSSDYILTDWF
jgi:hypothetical protein